MNDHNLDDLIIDTIQPKNSKSKSFLTIIALFIVVLIVGIILSKTYNNTSSDNTLTFDDNTTSVIAPELRLQEPEEITKPKEEPSLSKIIEEKLKEPEAPKEEPVSPIVEPTEKPSIPTEEPKVIVGEEKPKPIVEIKKPVEEKVKVTPKTETKKSLAKPATPKVVQTSKYYVQVGSFKQNPSPRFLSVIKSSGFKYHVSKPDAIGNKKLLIGPYKTRADVDKALVVVRDRIHKSAFVVQK
jgi:DedD protein